MSTVTVEIPTVAIAFVAVAAIAIVCAFGAYALMEHVIKPKLHAWKEREIAKINAKYADESSTGSEQ